MTRPRLYQRMLAPGATPYDIAKLLGDTVDTIERHYAPFVKELIDGKRRGHREESLHHYCTVARNRPEDSMKTTDNKRDSGGRACKPDSIMRKFAKSPRVFKLGITICDYVVYENIC